MAENYYPYGTRMLEQGDIESLDNWNVDKEMAFNIMDNQFDYLWRIEGDKIIFTDRLWSCGEEDDLSKTREDNETLELTFNSFDEVFKWIKEHSNRNDCIYYSWINGRLGVADY